MTLPTLQLTESAARHILKVLAAKADPSLMVRLSVPDGGCSCYQYKFDFDSNYSAANDVLVERDGAKLVVDKASLPLVQGSEIDYAESLSESGFKVVNPNATGSCGCGSSFSIDGR